MTRSAKPHSRSVSALDPSALVADYPSAPSRLADLRHATFSDDDEEGWIALQLAEQAGGAPPLLLCSFVPTRDCVLWDPERDEPDPSGAISRF